MDWPDDMVNADVYHPNGDRKMTLEEVMALPETTYLGEKGEGEIGGGDDRDDGDARLEKNCGGGDVEEGRGKVEEGGSGVDDAKKDSNQDGEVDSRSGVSLNDDGGAVAVVSTSGQTKGDAPPPTPVNHVAASISNVTTSCTSCSICIDDFVLGERLRVLPVCGHVFHTDCIMPWLTTRSALCPLCKRSALENSEEGADGCSRDGGVDGTAASTPAPPRPVSAYDARSFGITYDHENSDFLSVIRSDDSQVATATVLSSPLSPPSALPRSLSRHESLSDGVANDPEDDGFLFSRIFSDHDDNHDCRDGSEGEASSPRPTAARMAADASCHLAPHDDNSDNSHCQSRSDGSTGKGAKTSSLALSSDPVKEGQAGGRLPFLDRQSAGSGGGCNNKDNGIGIGAEKAFADRRRGADIENGYDGASFDKRDRDDGISADGEDREDGGRGGGAVSSPPATNMSSHPDRLADDEGDDNDGDENGDDHKYRASDYVAMATSSPVPDGDPRGVV